MSGNILFGERKYEGYVCEVNYVVESPSLEGSEIIYESPKFKYDSRSQDSHHLRHQEHSKIVAMLLADGWEPIQTDIRGEMSVFRRGLPNI